jgi:myosin heavy subunit
MKVGKVTTGVSGMLSTALLIASLCQPQSVRAEAGSSGTTQSTSKSSASESSKRGKLTTSARESDNYREDVVSAAVAELEASIASKSIRPKGQSEGAPVNGAKSSRALEDEIRLLREEKRALEDQHLALVKQLRELRSAAQTAHTTDISKEALDVERAKVTQKDQELTELRLQVSELENKITRFEEDRKTGLVSVEDSKAEAIAQAETIRRLTEELRIEKEKSTKLETAAADNERLLSRLPEVREKITTLKDGLTSTETKLNQCSSDLDAQKKFTEAIPQMKQELIAAKNQLILQETELRVLRGAADQKTLAELATAKQAARAAQQTPAAATAPATTSDMLIVEVTVAKGNLRSGPGQEHSPVMQVQRGTRLTVEARQGDWYQVFTPTGSRAFVSATTVRELNAAQAANGASARPSAPAPQRVGRRSRAAESEQLVPFGDVKSPPTKVKTREERALELLRKGVGKPNLAPTPPEARSAEENTELPTDVVPADSVSSGLPADVMLDPGAAALNPESQSGAE